MLEEKTNPNLVDAILQLKQAGRENDAPVWRAIAKQLEKPSRSWRAVNVGELQRAGDEDAPLIAVPGKVLGSGYLDQAFTVTAWSFSDQAKEKIEDAGGRWLRLQDAVSEFADGEDVQVIG